MTKEDFLGRIRKALHRHEGQPNETPPALLARQQSWDSAALVDQFIAEFEAVGGVCHRVEDSQEAAAKLNELVEQLGLRSYIASSDSIIQEVQVALNIPQATEMAAADVGISGVSYALANTGTMVLSSDAGRLAALLPMHHIALVRVSQIVPSMSEALDSHAEPLPTAWVQATGPSRTADIELTLSTGVHGPGIVHIILLKR